jgi:hypothetical protein
VCESCDIADRMLVLIRSSAEHDVPDYRTVVESFLRSQNRRVIQSRVTEAMIDNILATMVAKHAARGEMKDHIEGYMVIWLTLLEERLELELEHGGKHGQTDPDRIPGHKRP